MLKTLVVKINNMSSKFSSPFFKKSPLLGAYTSGADGMVTVSYNDIHQKFQDGIAKNVAKHYELDTHPCDDPLTTSYNKNGVYKKCPTVTTTEEEDKTINDTEEKPVEGSVGLSDYKKSNKTNPYYTGQGYQSPYTIDLPDLPELGRFAKKN